MASPRHRPPSVRRAALVFLLAACLAPAADSERGRPLVRTFARQEHKAHAQFFAPFQSAEGLMYFGNQLAVMEYDGRTWRVLPIPLPFTRALAPGPGGEIYVGDEDQFGVLARPDSGEPRYTSLLDRVPAAAKPFGFVRDIRVRGGDVWFATDKNLLRYRPADGTFFVRPLAGEARNRLSLAGDRLILHRQGEGLYEIEGETLRRLGNAPELAAPGDVFVVAGPAPSQLLLGLADRGLFTLGADGALAPFPTEADAILRRSSVLTGLRLRDGALAIGTVAEGVVILDAAGRLLRHIARESGLPHATVFALAEDREGGIWAGTNNAPARLLWRSAATVFDHAGGGLTDARATDLKRHAGTLYYLSNDGLFRLRPSADLRVPARFERDPRVDVQTKLSSLLSHPGGLLLAGGRGLQRLGADGLELLAARADGLVGLSASRTEPARVFFAHAGGIGTGTFAADGTWRDDGDIPGIDAACHDVAEDDDGTLWVGTGSKGVYRAVRPAGAADWRTAQVTAFGPADGLPAGHGTIFLWDTSLGLLFDTAHGLYRFDRAAGRFVLYRELTAFAAQPLVLNPVARGAPGELWTNGLATDIKTKEAPFPLLHLRARPDGTFAAAFPPSEIQDFFSPGAPYRIAWEAGAAGDPGIVWARGDQGLLRIELARLGEPGLAVAPLLRGLEAEGRTVPLAAAPAATLQLDYSREPIVFTWVSGLFRRTESERFQTRLVGFNDAWSAPVARNDIAFTNLEGGPFRFEVRTVDRQGRPGPAAAVTFRVAPPWPRSPAAYAAYAAVGIVALAGFVRWRLRAGERERARLERLVAARTAELSVAKEAADAASRAKSAFLANMSHELRTPLNGVIGYAQVLMKAPELSPKSRERLRVVQTSGEHLLRMINEVLDLSKIEAGKMELATAPFHLPQLLRDIAAAQQPRAQQKELEFVFDAAPELPDIVLGDSLKLRQVLDNLLGNAIKFTARGTVTLTVRAGVSPRPAPNQPEAGKLSQVPGRAQLSALNPQLRDTLVFSVTDTGVGLSADDRANLFQPFQQAADGRPPEPGTGLGLAISHRMVALMGGTLEVESEPGRGSRFHFSIPLPVLAVDATATRSTASLITGYHGRRRRLLVVDDVATNRDVLRDLLAPLGFEIAEANGGAEALRLVPEFRPDLVFLDLRMPDIDGLELTRRLRASGEGAKLKIIAMSASVLSFNRDDAFAAGCDDFLPKPFREDDLLARLGLALHLEWLGDSAGPAARGESGTPFALATRLPPEEVRALLAVAQRGEISALRQRLAAWSGDPLADALVALAKSYRMERIRELLEQQTAPERN